MNVFLTRILVDTRSCSTLVEQQSHLLALATEPNFHVDHFVFLRFQ